MVCFVIDALRDLSAWFFSQAILHGFTGPRSITCKLAIRVEFVDGMHA